MLESGLLCFFLPAMLCLLKTNKDAQLYASVCRVGTPLQDGSRASTPGSKMSQATSGMREVGPDGTFYLRVGTQWVKVGIPSLNLADLTALLTSCEVCTAAAWQCKLSQIPNTTKFANRTESCKAQKSIEANMPALQRNLYHSSSEVLSTMHTRFRMSKCNASIM